MAIYRPGQMGSFNGKMGEVVVNRWRQLWVGKSAPRPSSVAPTETQKSQRSKFGLATGFLSSIATIIAIGFKATKANNSPMNAAVSYHIARAITGVFPDFEVDYPSVVISLPSGKNEISMVESLEAESQAGHLINVTWVANEYPLPLTSDTDQAYFMFYNVNKERYLILSEVGPRTALTVDAPLPRAFVGDKVHGYLMFVSTDKKFVTRTEYLGLHTVLA